LYLGSEKQNETWLFIFSNTLKHLYFKGVEKIQSKYEDIFLDLFSPLIHNQ